MARCVFMTDFWQTYQPFRFTYLILETEKRERKGKKGIGVSIRYNSIQKLIHKNYPNQARVNNNHSNLEKGKLKTNYFFGWQKEAIINNFWAQFPLRATNATWMLVNTQVSLQNLSSAYLIPNNVKVHWPFFVKTRSVTHRYQ